MAELNKSNKQKIDVNTYRFASGRTIDEILKSDSRFWATDEQCLLNMIDSDWRNVEDFITEKEKELAKKFQAAANNPETDLKLLTVQSDVAIQFLYQKHTNQELWEKARNDPNGRTRPYSKDVVNIENQINFPYELPSWIKNSIEEIPGNWFERTPQQLQKEQEKEDIQTSIAIDSITKDIVIEPYSRKQEDIEAMKGFVAKVSGESIENITNEQAQAFIDNLGTPEAAFITAKIDGSYEYTNNNPYSSGIYKTSEAKKILSIIDDYAEEHSITNASPKSNYNYEFIHSVSENLNEIEQKMMEQLFDQSTNIVDTNSFGYMEFDDEGEHYSYYREIKYNEEKNTFIEKTTEEHWDKAYPYTKKIYYLYSPKEMFENHSFDFDDESVNKKFKDFVYEKYNKSLKSENIQSKTDLEHIKRDFSYIRDIFETGDSISVKNEMVGLISIDKGNIGKSGNGLQHICTQRFEKDGRSVDEITAMLALVVNSAENGTVSRNNEIYQNEKDIGTYDIEKNGIIAFVSKTRDGNDEKFVITGFDDNSKKNRSE